MTKLSINYNPYKMETDFKIDGEQYNGKKSAFKPGAKWTHSKLQDWVDELPGRLAEEFGQKNLSIEFTGREIDAKDVIDSFENAKLPEMPIIDVVDKKYTGSPVQKLTELLPELENSGLFNSAEGRKDLEAIKESLESAKSSEFPVYVIATMSAGKSTTLNAMLNRRLLPARNEATTAKISDIIDSDDESTDVTVLYENGDAKKLANASYDDLDKINNEKNVKRVVIKTEIPFVQSSENKLKLIDTPGGNNGGEDGSAHAAVTKQAIEDANALVIYLMNYTAAATNDDSAWLTRLLSSMTTNKQARERVLFAINKMDEKTDDDGTTENQMDRLRKYIESKGTDGNVENPQMFPISAQIALEARADLKDIDVDEDTQGKLKKEFKVKQFEASESPDDINLKNQVNDLKTKYQAISHIETFLMNNNNLLNYSSAPKRIVEGLKQEYIDAVASDDVKKQAEIQSGIRALEESIKQYMEKYAVPLKVKGVVDKFNELIEHRDLKNKLAKKISKKQGAVEKAEMDVKKLNEAQDMIESSRGNLTKRVDSFKKDIEQQQLRVIQDIQNDSAIEKKKQSLLSNDYYDQLTTSNQLDLNEDLQKFAAEWQSQSMLKIEQSVNEGMSDSISNLNTALHELNERIASETNVESLSLENVSINKSDSELLSKVSASLSEAFDDQEDITKWVDGGRRWYNPFSWFKKGWTEVEMPDTKRGSDVIESFFAKFEAEAVRGLGSAARLYVKQANDQVLKLTNDQLDEAKKKYQDISSAITETLEELRDNKTDLDKLQKDNDMLEKFITDINDILEG